MSPRIDMKSVRIAVVAGIGIPVIAVAAVLAFAWPAARIAPRDLPVGVVGINASSQRVAAGLDRSAPGGFDIHVYPDQAAARRAIEHREVFGAFAVRPDGITVLTASAAGPTVAQLLTTAGHQLAGLAGTSSTATPVHDVDVVATARDDPRGAALSAGLLPLTICGILLAAVVGVLLAVRPAWRQLTALCVLSAATGLGVYLVAQPFLGALPHEHLATWGALALTVLAISATTAGFVALLGTRGLGIGAALMMFVGNAFSGATSAPQLLPGAVNHIGQSLPPGAGANLLRSTAYFGGHGAGGHLAVLLVWTALGLGSVVVGHRFAPRPAGGEHERDAQHAWDSADAHESVPDRRVAALTS